MLLVAFQVLSSFLGLWRCGPCGVISLLGGYALWLLWVSVMTPLQLLIDISHVRWYDAFRAKASGKGPSAVTEKEAVWFSPTMFLNQVQDSLYVCRQGIVVLLLFMVFGS